MTEMTWKEVLKEKHFVALWENVNGVWSQNYKMENGHLYQLKGNDWVISNDAEHIVENIGYNNIRFFA